jgi:hypothetical protein
MRQLERELLPLRARKRQLLDEISSARSELAREQGATPMVIIDGTHGLDPKRKVAAKKQKQRVSAADAVGPTSVMNRPDFQRLRAATVQRIKGPVTVQRFKPQTRVIAMARANER